MKSLREYFADAEATKTAIGHFNISNMEGVWGVFNAAKKLDVPVVIGVSEGERSFFGVHEIVAVVRTLREQYEFPVFLNADHTYSFEKVKEAVDAGFDSVIVDGAKLPLEENIKFAKQSVEYAKSKHPDTLVEGELGFIGMSSKVLDAVPEGVDTSVTTDPNTAREFVKETGVDLLAPAVGNFHGMLAEGDEPLNIQSISIIRGAAGVPLVLHGGSGISHEDFKKGIEAGISMIHVSTELRVAYKKALLLSLQENPDEYAPYKYLKGPVLAIQKAVEEKLALFNNL